VGLGAWGRGHLGNDKKMNKSELSDTLCLVAFVPLWQEINVFKI